MFHNYLECEKGVVWVVCIAGCDTLRWFVGFKFCEFICGIIAEDLGMHMDSMKDS